LDLRFDENRVARLSSEAMKALGGLREISNVSKEEFLIKPHMVAGAKYYLIVSIEVVIDLSNHLISKNKFRILKIILTPSRYFMKKELYPGT
jgi:uncharacterized protein YutE (UPF0331/DUF86 family)